MKPTIADTQQSILLKYLFAANALFLAGFFLIPNAVDHYKFYSVAVFIPALLRFKDGFRLLRSDKVFLLVVAYFAYMLLSSAWSNPFILADFFDYVRLAIYILVFILLIVVLQAAYPNGFDLLLKSLCVLASIAAVVSITVWYREHPFPSSRLIGIGTLVNSVSSGIVYGIFILMCINYALRAESRFSHVGYLLLASPLICFVAFTQSRGVLLALTIATITLFFMKREKSGKFILAALVVLPILGVTVLIPEVYSGVFGRDAPARTVIWQAILDSATIAPVFGHGYLTKMQPVFIESTNEFIPTAHNVFLSTLRDGGLIGLMLLLAFLLAAYLQAAVLARRSSDCLPLVLLIYGAVCMLTYSDHLISRPRELWINLWLPLALIIGQRVARLDARAS